MTTIALGWVAALAAGFCPTAAEITETIGVAVRVFPAGTRTYGAAEMCAYQGIASADVFVSVSVQPVDPNEDPIAEVRASAKRLTGRDAGQIDVGEGGYAYGSASKSQAATRKGNRVYHAEIQGVRDKQAAVIGLLRRVVK